MRKIILELTELTLEEAENLKQEFGKSSPSEGDQDEKQTVSVGNIADLMVIATGQTDWTEDSVKQLLELRDVNLLDEYEYNDLTFDDFLDVLACHRIREKNIKFIIKLQEADKDAKGFLSPSIMASIMQEYGDSVDDVDIEIWKADLGVNEAGEINYRQIFEKY